MFFLLAPLLALPAVILVIVIVIIILIIVGFVLLIKKLTGEGFREHCTVCGGAVQQNVETVVNSPMDPNHQSADCSEIQPMYSLHEPDHLNFE